MTVCVKGGGTLQLKCQYNIYDHNKLQNFKYKLKSIFGDNNIECDIC